MRIQLLSIKYDDKVRQPILPLESNDVDALKKSPLVALTLPGDDLSQLASEWMGPGPWTFHQDLQLPASCSVLHFTNKNKRSYMSVTHLLKCVMRVERGDDVAIDPKTGKRKLFDIVVQMPVHILSVGIIPLQDEINNRLTIMRTYVVPVQPGVDVAPAVLLVV
jgi:hypothetical protein